MSTLGPDDPRHSICIIFNPNFVSMHTRAIDNYLSLNLVLFLFKFVEKHSTCDLACTWVFDEG